MTLQKPINSEVIDATANQDNATESLNLNILNHIRTLQDRSVTYSKGLFDLWGEAYIDSNGRMNSVNTTSSITTAYFYGTYYGLAYYDALSENDGGTWNTTHSYTVVTTKSGYVSSVQVKMYSTSANVTVTITNGVSTAAKTLACNSSSNTTFSFVLSDYSAGAMAAGNWTVSFSSSQNILLAPVRSYTGTYSSVSSSRLNQVQIGGQSLGITYTLSEGQIVHTIPTGTFSSTISKAIGTPLIADWETGADIKYKLTNATEDSDWLNYGEISSFTAFTSEPTALTVKLIPKSSSPTVGYPAIYGFGVRCS